MQRFEAYKLKQELEQQQKIAEMEKSPTSHRSKKAIEIERQKASQSRTKKGNAIKKQRYGEIK